MLHVPTLGTLLPARIWKKVSGLFPVTIELHQLSKFNLHFLMNPHRRLVHCFTQGVAFFVNPLTLFSDLVPCQLHDRTRLQCNFKILCNFVIFLSLARKFSDALRSWHLVWISTLLSANCTLQNPDALMTRIWPNL